MTHLLLSLVLGQINKPPKPGDWRFGWDRVGMIAAAALAVVFVAWIIMRLLARRDRRISHSPWCLFKQLCTAHGLSLRERQLITRLAQHYRLEQPTALFVEASWWEPQKLSESWGKCLGELEGLRKKLFAVR